MAGGGISRLNRLNVNNGSSALSTTSQRLAALGVLYRLRLWRMVDAVRLLSATETP